MTAAQRGGARPGAGRRPLPPGSKMVTVAFALPPKLLEQVDRQAKRYDLDRSKLFRQVLETGLKKIKPATVKKVRAQKKVVKKAHVKKVAPASVTVQTVQAATSTVAAAPSVAPPLTVPAPVPAPAVRQA